MRNITDVILSYFHRHRIQNIAHIISKTYRLRLQVTNAGRWWNAGSNLGFIPLFEAVWRTGILRES
jgi:hypothetical protein